ncbi:DUF5979 domain-containing protein [Microbacterium sp. 2FI]|uniref:DUF5979 domain-containing protein n=1 Tax=Microbacterium sp. 2FI TaxID=2502193 RepID=UPI0014858100|nr:DUF5979 domain-containing protein [Microbacterium sp. 2FI]
MSRTRRPIHRRFRRAVAAATAMLLIGSGAAALDTSLAAPAHAAYPDSFNPFAMNGGFTVYARENALLQNQEVEGSVAVGDTATVQGSSGTYSIIHVAAGTGDYTLPTVDGDPTRFLVGSYSPSSTGILAITSAGTNEPTLWGDLKMVERDGPWQSFARADWIRLNTNPANVDQTPLIDATHQRYPADSTPPTGPAGGNSIYTADTSTTAVADYVEANAEASYEAAADCLDGIAAGVGYPVGVAEDAGARVVLEPLSPDRPNVVDYTDIAGTALIQFSPGPTPGVANPLIIRVPAGTTEVIGARVDPQGTYSPYTFWDLSELTGPVSVTAAEGGRIDGSIYAPTADVTVTAAPLDGQVLGQNVTIRGGEVHTFLFAGQLTCDADSGTFAVSKSLEGIDPADLPPGTTFTVNYTATDPEGVVATGTLEVAADGTPAPAGEEFPIGTVIEFEEVEPASVPGYAWGTPTITPNPLTVGAGTAEIVVANTATTQVGSFSISKTIEDLSSGDGGAPSQATVPVDWVALYAGEEIGSGRLDVPFDGTPLDVGEDFPLGTRIVLTEDLSGIDPPPGYEWSGVAWNPGRTFVIGEDGAVVAVTLTNAIVPTDLDRTVTIVKSADGEAADSAYAYAVSYNTDPSPERTTRPLPLGDPELLDDLETDADTLELAELVPTLNGVPVDPAGWALPVITVTVDGETETFTPENFEGAGPLETAIVEIPLPESGDIEIEVANAVLEGTFELSKRFEGISLDDVPEATEFTVVWTATTPSGDAQRGVLRVPADGTPKSPLDADGAPRTFPYGTVITFEELQPPRLRQVDWTTTTFDPDELVIGAAGASVVSGSMVNSAVLLTGTFEVAKALEGIDADQLLIDSLTIDYVGWEPGGVETSGTFEIPTDGTPAGPVDEAGQPLQFPIGTILRLTEDEANLAALPPGYEWAETTWDPGNTVIVRRGEPTLLTVTNTVEQFTRFAVTKTVEGDGASAVPAGTTFPADWWWDYEPQTPVVLEPEVELLSPWFPVGSIIEARESALPDIPGVDWGTPVWVVDGQALTPDQDGKVVLPMTSTRDDGVVELTLANTAETRDLPATGGTGTSPVVPGAALAMIVAGLALLVARRRSRTATGS